MILVRTPLTLPTEAAELHGSVENCCTEVQGEEAPHDHLCSLPCQETTKNHPAFPPAPEPFQQ